MARFVDSQKTIWKFYYSFQIVDLFVSERGNHTKYPLFQINAIVNKSTKGFGLSLVTPFAMLTIGIVL